jgi:spermidine synthase
LRPTLPQEDFRMEERWYNEQLHDNYGQRFKIDAVLFEEKTPHQHLIIFENSQFGRVMALDGNIQLTTEDEHIYHEMMAHTPIMTHGKAKRVLIIGGGDGGILREVLKHQTIEQVTMVEIDKSVIDMCRKYLPSVSNGAFTDGRLNLVIDDGMRFVKETTERFDIIMVDSTDPVGPGEVLFTQEFYQQCKRCLNAGGIFTSQNGTSFLQDWEFKQTQQRLANYYKTVDFYLAQIPTYIGGYMMLAFASDEASYKQLSLSTIQQRFQTHPFDTHYYNPGIHVGAFYLPQAVLSKLNI